MAENGVPWPPVLLLLRPRGMPIGKLHHEGTKDRVPGAPYLRAFVSSWCILLFAHGK